MCQFILCSVVPGDREQAVMAAAEHVTQTLPSVAVPLMPGAARMASAGEPSPVYHSNASRREPEVQRKGTRTFKTLFWVWIPVCCKFLKLCQCKPLSSVLALFYLLSSMGQFLVSFYFHIAENKYFSTSSTL